MPAEAPREVVDIPDDYDPPKFERVWVRHRLNGNRGWLVRRAAKDCVRLDRENEDIIVPYRKGDWLDEEDIRPLTEAQMAQVAIEAVRGAMSLALGMHEEARKLDWRNMSDRERIKWMREGPASPPILKQLYVANMGVLRRWAAP